MCTGKSVQNRHKDANHQKPSKVHYIKYILKQQETAWVYLEQLLYLHTPTIYLIKSNAFYIRYQNQVLCYWCQLLVEFIFINMDVCEHLVLLNLKICWFVIIFGINIAIYGYPLNIHIVSEVYGSPWHTACFGDAIHTYKMVPRMLRNVDLSYRFLPHLTITIYIIMYIYMFFHHPKLLQRSSERKSWTKASYVPNMNTNF